MNVDICAPYHGPATCGGVRHGELTPYGCWKARQEPSLVFRNSAPMLWHEPCTEAGTRQPTARTHVTVNMAGNRDARVNTRRPSGLSCAQRHTRLSRAIATRSLWTPAEHHRDNAGNETCKLVRLTWGEKVDVTLQDRNWESLGGIDLAAVSVRAGVQGHLCLAGKLSRS